MILLVCFSSVPSQGSNINISVGKGRLKSFSDDAVMVVTIPTLIATTRKIMQHSLDSLISWGCNGGGSGNETVHARV